MSGIFGGGGSSAPATTMPMATPTTGKPKSLEQKVIAGYMSRRKPWLAKSILAGEDSDGGAGAAAGDAASAAADGGGVSI